MKGPTNVLQRQLIRNSVYVACGNSLKRTGSDTYPHQRVGHFVEEFPGEKRRFVSARVTDRKLRALHVLVEGTVRK